MTAHHTPHHPHTTRIYITPHITASSNLTLLPYNHEPAPRTLSQVKLRNSHPNTAHGVANKRHMAQWKPTETPDNMGSGDVTTPNAQAEEQCRIPYSATRWSSDSDTGYVPRHPIARATSNNTLYNHHTHPCKQNAPNTHMHRLRLTHQQHTTTTLKEIKSESAGGQGMGHSSSTCTAPPKPTMAPSPTTAPILPTPATTYRFSHINSPYYPIITMRNVRPHPTGPIPKATSQSRISASSNIAPHANHITPPHRPQTPPHGHSTSQQTHMNTTHTVHKKHINIST
jgi:hypothetical protein